MGKLKTLEQRDDKRYQKKVLQNPPVEMKALDPNHPYNVKATMCETPKLICVELNRKDSPKKDDPMYVQAVQWIKDGLPKNRETLEKVMKSVGMTYSDFIIVDCGKCELCRVKKGREWSSRMFLEAKTSKYGCAYVTLTYDDKHMAELGPNLSLDDFQSFMKRLRQRAERAYPGRKLRYFVVGEYGSKNMRKHYHIVIYGLDGHDHHGNVLREKVGLPYHPQDSDWKMIKSCWTKGYSKVERPRSPRAVGLYIGGYVNKIGKNADRVERNGLTPEFRSMSGNLGLEAGIGVANKVNQKKIRVDHVEMFRYYETGYTDKKTGKRKVSKLPYGRTISKKMMEICDLDKVFENQKKLDMYMNSYHFMEGIWLFPVAGEINKLSEKSDPGKDPPDFNETMYGPVRMKIEVTKTGRDLYYQRELAKKMTIPNYR